MHQLVLLLIVTWCVCTAAAPDAGWARGVLLLIESTTLPIALWTSRAGGLAARLLLVAVAAVLAAVQLETSDRAPALLRARLSPMSHSLSYSVPRLPASTGEELAFLPCLVERWLAAAPQRANGCEVAGLPRLARPTVTCAIIGRWGADRSMR